MTTIRRSLGPALLVALFAALLIQLPLAIANRAAETEWADPVSEVWSIIHRSFVDESRIDRDGMRTAAIHAMLETLNDPHTEYVPPVDEAQFTKQLRGTYVGIGAEVQIVDGEMTVISPMDGSPSLEAGVSAGDVILAIAGESTEGKAINDAVEMLAGEPGTQVTVRVRHLDGEVQDLVITRRHITTATVKGIRRVGEDWNYCLDPEEHLYYLRVTQFNESTIEEMREAFREMPLDDVQGLILDLRDNLGGALPTAVEMADMFLADGVVVSVRDREGRGPIFRAQQEDTVPHFPMMVLVNQRSASASEIVAGALQDNGRAIVLGERTFGKGSVQDVRPLDYHQGVLKYTTAYYYLPSGRNINRLDDSAVWGVDPDIGFVAPMSNEQWLAWQRARREYEIIREPENGAELCVDAEWIEEHTADHQLAQAVSVLHERLVTGEWSRVSEHETAAVAFDHRIRDLAERRALLLRELADARDEIEELTGAAATAQIEPLLPESADLNEGTIVLRDREGNVVGEFIIESGDVALALETLVLRKAEAEPAPAGEPSS